MTGPAKRADDDVLLAAPRVAVLLDTPVTTLAKWRHYGKGPESIVIGGRSVRYWRSDVLAWIKEQSH